MKHVSIAIDGPAGAGKSTLARKAAGELGFLYVDTGAIYRTVALKVRRAGADPERPEQVVPLLEGLDLRMDYGPDGAQRMYLEGEDISQAIRTSEVSGLASKVSAIPEARARRRLLELQQRGEPAEYERVLADILRRDEQDRTRSIAPLRQAEDAVLLDTTNLNLAESLQALLSMIKERIAL